MQELVSQITRLDEQMDDTKESLRSFSASLGRLVSHASLHPVVAPALQEELVKKEEELLAIQEEEKLFNALYEAKKEGQKEQALLEKERLETQKRLEAIHYRLGAIAFEQAQSDGCDVRIKGVLAPIISRYERLKETTKEGSFLQAAKSRLLLALSNQDKDFFSIFSTLEKEGLLFSLKGERALSILEEYKVCVATLKRLEEQLASLSQDMGSAEEMTKEHEESMEKRVKEKRIAENEAAISYGTYLFENLDKWLCETTSEEIVELVHRMLLAREELFENAKIIEQKKNQIDVFQKAEKIRINEKAIGRLEAERERLRRQIDELQAENELLQKQMHGELSHE